MRKFSMMTASELFTTAVVVAFPTPWEPPLVVRPAWALSRGMAAP